MRTKKISPGANEKSWPSKARENTSDGPSDQVAILSYFISDWFNGLHEFFKANHKALRNQHMRLPVTLDTELKIVPKEELESVHVV